MADKPPTAAEPATPEEKTAPVSRRRRVWRWIALITLTVVMLAAGAAGYAAWQFYRGEGPADDIVLVVPRGSGVMTTAALLEKEGAISDHRLFAGGVRLIGSDRYLLAGEYRIPAGSTMHDVMGLLHEGRTVVRRLTIPEGLSVKQITALIRAEEALTGEVIEMPAEGSLLPETYHISLGDDRAALVARMQRDMVSAVEALWSERADNLPLSTPQEALILASIVEKESGIDAERPRIAAVFVNRLRKGMKLQSDPTVIYGLTAGEPLGRPILLSELKRQTPYNTYHVEGLPPTPIANPGIDSIRAVLNPIDSKELYFVADGTGGHAFARTYREHQANVRKWRRLNRQR